MSDIPMISITKDCSDEELDDVSKLNINEALTDTEDLIMEQDTVRFRKGSSPLKNQLVDAIKPTMNGSVTDVEDCTDSDEEESEVRSAREVDITLDNFLDQGYVDETTKSRGNDNKPKTLTRCSSKATESSTPASCLHVCSDPVGGALTDCEDCALSDDDDSLGKISIPDCPEDILTRSNENDSSIDIHNAVKGKEEKHFHKQEMVIENESSSESDTENARVRHRKCHRKSDDRPKSDCEDFSMSEDEATGGACARPPNRRSALFEAEELTLEGSDVDEEQSHVFPEINITFVTDEQETPTVKKMVSRPTALGVEPNNPDEALTDVENLDSSDSEEQMGKGKRLMPRAVVRANKSCGGGGGLTDVEDFNDSGDNDEPDQRKEVPHEYLPSPVREIAIVKHDETGEQRQNVMPLNQGLLTVRTPDVEQALTDVEDMSEDEDEGELYDSSKYTLGTLPEMESGDVYSSENPPINPNKLELKSPAHEPVTDTEELFLDRSNSTGCSGSELRRRRKPKQGHAHTTSANASFGQFKGKKTLDTKPDTTAAATTDVEDMYLSGDDANDCGLERTKQRRATIQFSNLAATAANADNDLAKTDVEFLSGDELVPGCRMQSPQLCNDGFSSIVKARERNGPIRHSIGGTPDVHPHNTGIPMIRKISPSPDAYNCNTDCEDIQIVSDDGDEQQLQEDGRGPIVVSYSRAQTATPFELTRALEETGGSCEIHDSSARAHSELLDVKGGCGVEAQDAHTDVEFLDDGGEEQ